MLVIHDASRTGFACPRNQRQQVRVKHGSARACVRAVTTSPGAGPRLADRHPGAECMTRATLVPPEERMNVLCVPTSPSPSTPSPVCPDARPLPGHRVASPIYRLRAADDGEDPARAS